MSNINENTTETTAPLTTTPPVVADAAPAVKKRRPKSQLRLQLEALQTGQEITLNYANMKTPFSVLIAIKRQQLGKHFVFEEVATGQYKVKVGTEAERSHSLRSKTLPA